MESNKITKDVIEMARLSTAIELFLGILAFFILPQAFLIGLGGVLTCFFVGHFAIQNPNAFWRGQLFESYCSTIANRHPTIQTLIFDNFILIVLLVYAFFKVSAISCGLLGIAAAISSITIIQSYQQTKWATLKLLEFEDKKRPENLRFQVFFCNLGIYWRWRDAFRTFDWRRFSKRLKICRFDSWIKVC